jgi:hypothetical protein
MILGIAAMLTFLNIPLASSQGITLTAARVSENLPVNDPSSPLWQKAPALQVPLSTQAIAPPMLLQTSVKAITARALFNGTQIAILVEWADKTKNDQMIRSEDFRDALAVQFPLVEGPPFVCMGQPNGDVNVWHWKADWQTDLTAWQDLETRYPNMNVDYYPFAKTALPAPKDYADPNYVPAFASNNLFAMPRISSVEDLDAIGFGTLTSQPAAGQNVKGDGAWANDKWRVIFSRDLNSPDADDIKFAPNKTYAIAFAAWDGANGERNGQKAVSQWATLDLSTTAVITNPTYGPALVLGILIVALTTVLVLTRLKILK